MSEKPMSRPSSEQKLHEVLQAITQNTTVTAEELKRLRELRHNDSNSLQSFALNSKLIEQHFQNQERIFEEFRKESRDQCMRLGEKFEGALVQAIENFKEGQKKISEELMTIQHTVMGPPGKPQDGIPFKVEQFQHTVEAIHRLMWIGITSFITCSVTGIVGFVLYMLGIHK